MAGEYKRIKHQFKPIYDKNSKILILGTLPSVKSREQNFYYGHPQNRFWKVVSKIVGEAVPVTVDDKIKMLINNNIAIWDVIAECDIIGSDDNSIRNVIPNDIKGIIENSNIKAIYTNGQKAHKLYKKFVEKETEIEAINLLSTSPANARYNVDKLTESWKEKIKL